MAHPQLVYCVENIFGQCLKDYGGSKHRIAAYQRGYKWDAEVGKLLSDLHEAFTTAERTVTAGEYYLQYITVQHKPPTGQAPAFLDVIDGQQRLTTLSLLFAVVRELVPNVSNFTEHLLVYAVRENFLEEFVYAGNVAQLLLQPADERRAWADFIAPRPSRNCQDVWYLFKAARKIRAFVLNAESTDAGRAGFAAYVAQRVMLIVNLVDARVPSEKVFRNLNSTKVLLTETELLKGLLLTKVAREPVRSQSLPSPREVVEIRHAMGRQWDEMARWLNGPAVAGFFQPADLAAPSGQSLFPLLKLVAGHTGYVGSSAAAGDQRLPVFEYFQKCIRHGRPAAYFFEQLRLVFALLRDWYERPETHNLLGFLFFSKEHGNKSAALLRTLTSEKWLRERQREGMGVNAYLKGLIHSLECVDRDSTALRYHQDDSAIHDLLLLVNVFPAQPRPAQSGHFDFARFGAGAWSLEHVFPQTPRLDHLRRLPPADQRRVVQLVEPVYRKRVGKLLLQKAAFTESQRAEWEGIFWLNHGELDRTGNLALLERGHNSKLTNALFDEKRRRIVTLVSGGGFVPPHTFNVFSRLLADPGSGSALLWAKEDMHAHAAYLEKERLRLRSYLTPALP